MSNELIAETIECLRATFKVTDNELRKQAEERLKSLESDLLNHFRILLELIKDQSQVENEIKLSIVIYMKKMIKEKLQNKSLLPEYALEILKHIIDLVLVNHISEVCLNNLMQIIKDILDYKQIADNKSIVNEILINLYHYLEKLTVVTPYRIITIVLEKIIESSSVSHSNAIDVMNKLMSSVEFMFNKMLEGFKTIDIQNNLSTYLLCVDICKHNFTLLYSAVTKMRSRLNMIGKVYESIAFRFVPIAIQLAMMTIPNVMPVYFIAWQGDSSFDISINSMKSKALLFLNSILQSKKEKITENQLVPLYTELVQASVRNLEFVVSEKYHYIQNMDKDGDQYPDYNYENVIYQIILFLSRILIREPFINDFGQFAYKFVVSIVIPLLKASPKEIENMNEDGEEYSNYISDVINDHKGKNIKAVSAYLLLILSEKYTSSNLATNIITYLIEVMEFGIKGSNIDTFSQYNKINPNDNIFKIASLEYHIELSLLMFSILAPVIIKSDDLMEYIKTFFINNFETIMTAKSDIIKNRLAIFIGNFLDTLFEVNDPQFTYCLEFLFINLLGYKSNEGIAHECADALNDILSVKKISTALKDPISKHLNNLKDGIKEASFSLYFDVIHEIVLNIDIDEFVVPLVKALVDRIITEVVPQTRIKFKISNTNNSNKYNLIINKSFNIIRCIIDKEIHVMKYILYLEEILKPLFDYMKTPKRIDFDEDIILVITSFIKYTKTIPQSALMVLPYLPLYLKKSKGLTLDLYELLNQYVVYGNGIIDVNEEYNRVIVKIFTASFDKKCEYDLSGFLSASLIHIWLQNSPSLNEGIINDIVTMTFNQIQDLFSTYKDMEELEGSNDIYTFVALMVVIYSSFINYPIISFKIIIAQQNLDNLIKFSQVLTQIKFFNTYLTKSIIIGLCSILKNDQVIKEVPVLVTSYLTMLLILLNKQKNEESKKLKQALKSEVSCNFVDSDEEDEESEEENLGAKYLSSYNKKLQKLGNKLSLDDYDDVTNEKEIKEICDRTINPVKMVDEYEYYKNSIELLSNYDRTLFDNWINTLKEKDKEVLNNIIHTRRIQIKNNSFEANVPRKVVKVKRSTNI